MVRSDSTESENTPLPRRQFLRGFAATAGASSLAGCNWPWASGPITLPALNEVWTQVQENGEVKVVLHFDEDIKNQLENSPVSERDLMSKAASEGVSIDIRDVTVPGTENIPRDETISGVARGLVTMNSWPAGTQYVTKGLTLPDNAIEIEFEGQTFAVKLPVNQPTYPVIFPSGFQYTLLNPKRGGVYQQDGGYFDYQGYSRSRTVPAITHYDTDIAGRARMFDFYREEVLNDLLVMTDSQKYDMEVWDDIQQAITNLTWELTKEALSQFVPSRGVSLTSSVGDMKSFHDSLTKRLPHLERALDKLKDRGVDMSNRNWVDPAHELISDLKDEAETDAEDLVPAWTTASNKRESAEKLQAYIDSISREIRMIDNFFEASNIGRATSGLPRYIAWTVRTSLFNMRNRLVSNRVELRTIASAL